MVGLVSQLGSGALYNTKLSKLEGSVLNSTGCRDTSKQHRNSLDHHRLFCLQHFWCENMNVWPGWSLQRLS